jgi:pyridoxamine 5'-phosphate oxidase
MTDSLFATAPGFDQPIAVLKHCHDKIRKQITTLQNLLDYLPQHGAAPEARQAASAVLQYFTKAAQLHHTDEEQDLMPMLQACASGADAAVLAALVPDILSEHRQMDLAWNLILPQLEAIADGSASALSGDAVARFASAYLEHMKKEESTLAPMALRLFSAEQMTQLGAAMQQRRNQPVNDSSTATATTGSTVAGLRKDYSQASLMEADVLSDPIAQFARWFDEALLADVNEPNAMSLATVAANGKPSSRIVLIKQFDASGFTWFTNYQSDKGQQLAANPHAALLFFWPELERQVRIEGPVVRAPDNENDDYFASRPLKSRLAAIASKQSAPVASRAQLDANFDAVAASSGDSPPRPAHWGGYRMEPTRIEFWQGRQSRFHDRIVYTRQPDGTWLHQRLQP